MKKSKTDVREIIFSEIRAIQKQKPGQKKKPGTLTDKTPLFGAQSGLDSLDLAELIVKLEGRFGADPFKEGRMVRTVRELASFYEKKSKK